MKRWLKENTRGAATFSLVLALAACAIGPDYEKPSAGEIPAAYKEQSGDWNPAAPGLADSAAPWWETFGDPALNDLEKQVDVSNQNLKEAEAALRGARAAVDESEAALFPTLSLSGSSTRSGTMMKKAPTTTKIAAAAGASWEPDLWGRLRRTAEGDEAAAQVSEADLAAVRLSMQGAVASNYFALRAQDSLQALLDATVKTDEESLKIAQNRYAEGVAAQADVVSAQAQRDDARSSAIHAGILRAQLEHALAALVGKTPAAFSLAIAPLAGDPPPVPAEVPSALLQRRPDIAAAEREMAAANAQIGVETATFFPNLTLSASYGYTGAAFSKLLQASNSLWAVGPALAETIFDAGARSARVGQAQAAYDEKVAAYRQTTLTAFQQVEDQLVALRLLAEQTAAAESAVKAAQTAEKLVTNQYKEGVVAYSSVLTAQTARLLAEQNALTVCQNRFAASVSLIEALGGGWKGLSAP